jgi:hypothetical protein
MDGGFNKKMRIAKIRGHRKVPSRERMTGEEVMSRIRISMLRRTSTP